MLLINSSNVIQIGNADGTGGLKNAVTGEWVNDAAVTVTIVDSAGAELAGVTWPQALPYVSGSNGIYRETFAAFTELKEGETYTIKYNVVGADTLTLQTTKKERAQILKAC